jgi:hypothetical protein
VPISKRKVTYEDATIVDAEKRNQAFGQRDHVRVYGEDYYDGLTEAGFIALTENNYVSNNPISRSQIRIGPRRTNLLLY